MANRYFNKQTTNARQALAQGGAAADPKKPKTGKTFNTRISKTT